MGQILQNFTITRNILGKNAAVSASRILSYVDLVGDEISNEAYSRLSKGETNDISSIASYTGLFVHGPTGGYQPTDLNKRYRGLQSSNPTDAWQWLITRSLWHFILPNGTTSPLNKIVRDLKVTCPFFKNMLGLLSMLEGLSGADRFLYFYEFCVIFNDDANWKLDAPALFDKLLTLRKKGEIDRKRHLIDDLETEFKISRDNLNTMLVKAFSQTGLFEYAEASGGVKSGIALSSNLSDVLQRRVRHILDSELSHTDPETSWPEFIASHDNDLPLEVEREKRTMETDTTPSADISPLCTAASTSMNSAGLIFKEQFMKRFVAALLTKPFLILTGLSGSGKTKLAHAFAAWITDNIAIKDPFSAGARIESERINYYVINSDRIAVQFSNSDKPEDETIVTLPRDIIKEWARYIEANSLSRETSARSIREAVVPLSKYSSQLHSFETHLKAAAFALLNAQTDNGRGGGYNVVPVGADWTSNENILGYRDALNTTEYRKPVSGALDIILRAELDRNHPYFLILDEMNLSHVEKYLADLLSAIESEKEISLHAGSEPLNAGDPNSPLIPPKISIPKNLFIIGTVNVDETTYMFSPKVLDRANVLEFVLSKEEMMSFLEKPTAINMSLVEGKGLSFSQVFVEEAMRRDFSLDTVQDIQGTPVKDATKKALETLFDVLAPAGAEFGYRPAYEITRFIYYYAKVSGENWKFDDAIDAAIMQKLLPKLHGSKTKLDPILKELKKICEGKYAVSYSKILRMEQRLKQNGFTSYAEA